MGVFSGTISFVRFFVEGEVPADFREPFLEQIRQRALQPLDPDEDDEEAIGWCPIAHPLRLEFAHDDVFINNFVNLGLRIDRWAIPAPLLKARLAEAEALAMQERGVLKLRRGEKEELRKLVISSLRRQLLPSMRVTDLSWDIDGRVVRFWSSSTRLHERLEDLFAETFGLRLVVESPYSTAARVGLTASRLTELAELEPARFHLTEQSQPSGASADGPC